MEPLEKTESNWQKFRWMEYGNKTTHAGHTSKDDARQPYYQYALVAA